MTNVPPSPTVQKPPCRKPYTDPLTEEEQSLVRQKAHAIWKERKDDSKNSPQDDWNTALDALKKERIFPGKRLRQLGHWTGFGEKNLWDILQLIIVPAVLASGVFYLQEAAKQRDQKVSNDQANQETLVKYLDQMSELLDEGLLKAKPNSEKFIISQAKTVLALRSLDPARQTLVIQFLDASTLNQLDGKGLLYKARLSGINFKQADLRGGVFKNTDFSNANMSYANLSNANLSHANLSSANLSGADLSGADLSKASLYAADLSQANLYRVNFREANLFGTKLSEANLFDAYICESMTISPNQVKKARYWESAAYTKEFRAQLGILPSLVTNGTCDQKGN